MIILIPLTCNWHQEHNKYGQSFPIKREITLKSMEFMALWSYLWSLTVWNFSSYEIGEKQMADRACTGYIPSTLAKVFSTRIYNA